MVVLRSIKSSLRISRNLYISVVLLIVYSIIIVYPIYDSVVIRRRLFGLDVPQYLLTARNMIEGKKNIFNYPYPLLPVIYLLPSIFIKDLFTLYVLGLFISGFIMITMVIIAYNMIRNILKAEISAIISALTLGLSPLLLDTIGWGGQSTLVAILWGLLALTFMHMYLRDKMIKYFIISLFSLSLSTFSEPFISGYFIVSNILLILFTGIRIERNNARILKTLIKRIDLHISILFSIMLMMVTWFYIRWQKADIVQYYPLGLYIIEEHYVLWDLLYRLTYQKIVIFYSFILIASAYLTIKLITKHKNDLIYLDVFVKATGLALIMIILATPAQYADRGAALYPIPLSTMLGAVTDHLISNGNRIRSCNKLLAVTALILTLLSFSIGLYIYNYSLSFYHVDKEFLEFVSPLRYEEGEVIIISPSPWVFPLAYITGKNISMTSQPVWFIDKSQVEASITAMTIAWGTRWIEAGELKVVDSTPIGFQPSLAIYVAKYPYYVELFRLGRLGDAFLPIEFSPMYNESIIWYESPYYARKVTAWNSMNAMYSMYEYETLIVNKTVNVDDEGTAFIVLDYHFINSFPRRIDIRLVSLMINEMEAYTSYSNNTYARVHVIQVFREPWIRLRYITMIECQVSDNATLSAEYIERDEWGLPEIRLTIIPTTRIENIKAILKIRVLNIDIKKPYVVVQENVLRDKNIRWIIVDRGTHHDIIFRFEKDPLYEKYAESHKYMIFRVKNVT